VLPPPVIARLDRQLPFLWPPGPLALAGAASRVARLALARASGWVCLFLVPPPEHDMRVRGVAVPALVTGAGVRPLWPLLAPRDRVRLDSAIAG
jgi:hypothetical protein